MSIKGFTAEELSILSEEEKAALAEQFDEGQGDDDTGDEGEGTGGDEAAATAAKAAEEAAAKKAAEGDDDDDAKKAAEEAAAKAKAEEEAAAAAAAGDDEGAAAAAAAEETRRRPASEYAPPEGAKERLEEISKELDDLAVKFDEGEITAKEYRDAQKPLHTEERQLHDKTFKVELARDNAITTWRDQDVPDFLDKHPAYKSSETLWTALDQRIRKIQVERPADALNPKILEEAHAAIAAELPGVFGEKQAGDPPPKAKGEKRDIPPSLAGLPASAIEQANENRFAKLDKLSETDIEAYEKELARMSDVDRDAYLAQ